jgi:hypothetical protein
VTNGDIESSIKVKTPKMRYREVTVKPTESRDAQDFMDASEDEELTAEEAKSVRLLIQDELNRQKELRDRVLTGVSEVNSGYVSQMRTASREVKTKFAKPI